MSELKWYVASVRSCQERRVAEKLSSRGIRAYVPVQKVKRQWSDRVKVVDKLLIPGLVFVRCDDATRRSLFEWLSGIAFFLMDRGKEVRSPLVVPDSQMEDFMAVVLAYNEDPGLAVVTQDIAAGDTVKVIRGPLEGRICECVEIQTRHKIVIRLGSLGSVLASISPADVRKV